MTADKLQKLRVMELKLSIKQRETQIWYYMQSNNVNLFDLVNYTTKWNRLSLES
jgi:hypothetical protein